MWLLRRSTKVFPLFGPNKESAFRAISLEAAENVRKILRYCKIESEIIEVDASAASTAKP
jgi:hypothetical protein